METSNLESEDEQGRGQRHKSMGKKNSAPVAKKISLPPQVQLNYTEKPNLSTNPISFVLAPGSGTSVCQNNLAQGSISEDDEESLEVASENHGHQRKEQTLVTEIVSISAQPSKNLKLKNILKPNKQLF
jgi:hypothetical protein